ncbi:MAG: asparagine synthase (glutamine-hydrolyzing) [Desulfobacter sp.]|nr:MAG: asparagine synthase (glutamine-hydrolyzing) [Desulfobacter sp.]
MCGITGIAGFKGYCPNMNQLQSMCDTLYHRGPDDEGLEIRNNVGLAMRRLSIIDISGGKQPIYNEDNTVRVILNGEIYNFKKLRQELESKGHLFKTRSDTESIVHAYEEYGIDFPLYLNGMFATVIHDLKKKRILIARDHLGIKPLFYYYSEKCIIWGSEIKSILASRLVKKQLNMGALGEFISWEYISGSQTLFKNIHKLEPGNILVVDLENPSCKPKTYWDIPNGKESIYKTMDEWSEEVDFRLKQSVKDQLVSDVPLGAFLSGGVDSSLITAAMGQASTFSIGFDDPTYNELKWAREVAEYLNLNHTDEIIKPDITGLFDKLMHFMDDPIGDFSIFPTFLVSKLARKSVTVALSGDGGDELFGGYETYLADQKAEQYNRIPLFLRHFAIEPAIRSLRPRRAKKGLVNKAKRFIEGLTHPQEFSHARWRLFAGEEARNRLFTTGALQQMTVLPESHILNLFNRAETQENLNKSLYVDVKSYLCDNCLVKTDRMSMAASLEVRVPFLDKELVELAFKVPSRFKIHKGKTKVLLKKIAAQHVPNHCVYRPKEGFSIPIKNWLAQELRPLMNFLLERKRLEQAGIFNSSQIEIMKNEHLTGRENHSHILWTLMVFESWYDRWFKG